MLETSIAARFDQKFIFTRTHPLMRRWSPRVHRSSAETGASFPELRTRKVSRDRIAWTARASFGLVCIFSSQIFRVAVRSPTVVSLSRPLCASHEGTERDMRLPADPRIAPRDMRARGVVLAFVGSPSRRRRAARRGQRLWVRRGVVVSNRLSLTESSRVPSQHRTESFTACSRTQVGACRLFAPVREPPHYEIYTCERRDERSDDDRDSKSGS